VAAIDVATTVQLTSCDEQRQTSVGHRDVKRKPNSIRTVKHRSDGVHSQKTVLRKCDIGTDKNDQMEKGKGMKKRQHDVQQTSPNNIN
jgi:hypothetical protein